MTSSSEAIQELRSMGLTPVIAEDACHLEVDGERLPLGANPDWRRAVEQARDWLDRLGDAAGARGADLRRRRNAAGFPDLGAFCDYTGLDEGHTYEAEEGLGSALPVHLRILDWLERGELRRKA